MHREVDYNKLPEDKKEAKAIADLKQWYGVKKFNQLEKMFKEYQDLNIEQFKLMVSFTGVTGYPVEVWHKRIWG